MYEGVYVAMLIGFPLAGLLLRRWWVVLAPAIAWPIFGLGYSQEWWGDGAGDGWWVGLALVFAFSVLTTWAAILAGAYLSHRRHRVEPPLTGAR